MSYIDGFVIAVPTANKQKFIEHARRHFVAEQLLALDEKLQGEDADVVQMPGNGLRAGNRAL